MKVLLFGATGMTGQGVLQACLQADDVSEVLAVVRRASGRKHPKLRELIHADMGQLAPIEDQLQGFDACFFCIGITSTRVGEAAYTRVTHDITLAVASTLARVNPASLFVYLSGARTDSSEQSRMMQERVRGRAENALRKLPFRRIVILRPEMIVPVAGDRPSTPALRLFYAMMKPLLLGLRVIAPHHIATTRQIGAAMLQVARAAHPKQILGGADLHALTRAQK
jgi:uncharacterized protein YbjT (DUF2867 family)